MAANTPANYYLDTPALAAACQKEKKAIEKACESKDKKGPSAAEQVMGKKAAKRLEELKAKFAKAEGAPPWVMQHCDGLWFKPVSPKQSEAIKEMADKLKEFDSAAARDAIQKQLGEVIGGLDTMIKDLAVEAAKSAAVKAGARTAAGSIFGPIGAALVQVINVVDTVITAVEVGGKVIDLKDEISGLKKVLEDIPGKLKEIAGDATKNPQKAMAETMGLTSRLDACTRARRCQMVPMKETHDGNKLKCDGDVPTEDTDISGPAHGKGCCPGQTGHHMLPGAMFKKCGAYQSMGAGGCPHQNAPTVCVEGVNNAHGTHGAIHRQLDKQLTNNYPNGMTVDQAVDEGADSVRSTFPESGCSKKCLKAQLHNFYDKFKGCEPLQPSAGSNGGMTSDGGKG